MHWCTCFVVHAHVRPLKAAHALTYLLTVLAHLAHPTCLLTCTFPTSLRTLRKVEHAWYTPLTPSKADYSALLARYVRQVRGVRAVHSQSADVSKRVVWLMLVMPVGTPHAAGRPLLFPACLSTPSYYASVCLLTCTCLPTYLPTTCLRCLSI